MHTAAPQADTPISQVYHTFKRKLLFIEVQQRCARTLLSTANCAKRLLQMNEKNHSLDRMRIEGGGPGFVFDFCATTIAAIISF
jgi:hypothetical protein